MAFDSTLINFLTVGDFSNASYGVPLSQQLVTAESSGLVFANAGGGGSYTLGVNGNLSSLMNLQDSGEYGIVISVPQAEGGLITRQITGGSTIQITGASGRSGNPTISVVPSSSLQLTAMQVGGSTTGAAHSTLNLIAGANIGISAVDTGTKTNVTINSTISAGILAAPVITYTASSDFTAEQNIGLLTTGLLKNTVTAGSGVLTTAVSGTDYLLPNAALASFAALSPTNGQLLYYTGGGWSLLSPGTTGYVLKTTGATSVAWAAGGDVTLAGTNAFTGTNTFNTNLPTSTKTPTTSTQLVTKAYADSIIGGAPLGATYLTASANGTLTNEVSLGALATGLVLSTVTAGVSAVTTVPASTFQPAETKVVVQTTNDTPLAAVTITNPIVNSVVTLHGRLQGTNAAVTDGIGAQFMATALFNTGSATWTTVGSPYIVNNTTSLATLDVLISGSVFALRVTGLSATTYNWDISYTTVVN